MPMMNIMYTNMKHPKLAISLESIKFHEFLVMKDLSYPKGIKGWAEEWYYIHQ